MRACDPPHPGKAGAARRRGPAGFTLLEVMVALGIMAIVLTSVYRLQAQTLTMSMESRFYTQAPLLARSALTRYEEASRREQRPLASDHGDFGVEFPGYAWKITVDESPSQTLGADISRDLKRIEVLVSLNGGQYSYGLRTYRFVRE
jgi:prepilin-type N-terminal cleavage/methylation domain-containing protein